MTAFLIVACGSALGGALRHGVNLLTARLFGVQFPYGTLTVNIVGSFLMGVLAAYFALKGQASQSWRLFLTTGIMGGFTTFSAFSLDTIVLYERGQIVLAFGYACGSVVVSLVALFAAMTMTRALL